MKDLYLIIIIMTISVSSMRGQHIGIYISESDSNTFVNINKYDIEIYQVLENFGVEDILERNIYLKSKYKIVSDSILFYYNDKQLRFHVIAEGILQLKDGINHLFSCNTRFYCIRKKDENGKIIYFGKWKNGLKDGDWLYFNELGQRVIVTYDKGEKIGQSILKE